MTINGVIVAPAVKGSDIEWLAALDPGPRPPSTAAVRRRLSVFRDMAAATIGAIDAAVENDDVDEHEAQPLRNLVQGRLAILNRDLRWSIPIEASNWRADIGC
ncbi:MAG: hypothetical protein ACJ8AW_43130 [Rhodopila sp.]